MQMREGTNTCFYCQNAIEDQHVHYVSIVSNAQEREETLCDVCYSEWLEGTKG